MFFLALSSLSSFGQCPNPSSVSAAPNVTSVNIFWNPVPNAIGYTVTLVGVGVINATSAQTVTTFGGLIPDTLYTFSVQALCVSGASNPVSGGFRTLPSVDEEDFCVQPAPLGTFTSGVTETTATLNWNSNSTSGYQIAYRIVGTGNENVELALINGGNINSFIIEDLLPETEYEWQIRSRCPNGRVSILSSISITFTTLNDCPLDRTIIETATSESENFLSAQNTITAINVIQNGVSAGYDAGNTVVLLPGFHAQSGSTFTAFIEGCTPTRSRDNFSTEPINEFAEIEKLIKVFPNPTTNMINIESEDEINSIQIINQIGNIGANQRFLEKDNRFSLNISNYPSGIYFLRIIFEDGEILNKTVIKK